MTAAFFLGCALAGGCGRNKVHPGDPPGTGGSPVTPEDGGAGGVGGKAGGSAANGIARGLRRLSNREYNNVVRDLLGDVTRPADQFIADSYQNGYDNGSVGLVVQSDQVEGFQLAAESLAVAAVTTQLSRLLDGCDPATSGDAACIAGFFASFPGRAFRRAASDAELGRLRAIYDQGAEAGGMTLGLQLVVETILQSPQFLYREELGTLGSVPENAAQVRLTPDEIASSLSFLLTGSMPDAALIATLKQGRLNGPADYQREARRLLGTPAARDAMRTFLHQWLATDRLGGITKDVAVYPAFGSPDAGLAMSMRAELDRDFDQVLWNGSGSLRELFTSTDSFVDPALGSLYGLEPSGGGWKPVSLDPLTRRGVLTRAGYLAVHADQDSSGPIARGVFLLGSVLCTPPLPRPATVPVPPSVADTALDGKTTRQRFEQHVSDARCAGCHRIIDGIGFGFEEFDGIGVHRATENGTAIDSSGALFTTGDIDGPFTGVSALAGRLVAGHSLPDCFVKQVYRFAMGQIETPSEQAVLSRLQQGFSVDQPVTDLLIALVADPAFVRRNTEQQKQSQQQQSQAQP